MIVIEAMYPREFTVDKGGFWGWIGMEWSEAKRSEANRSEAKRIGAKRSEVNVLYVWCAKNPSRRRRMGMLVINIIG